MSVSEEQELRIRQGVLNASPEFLNCLIPTCNQAALIQDMIKVHERQQKDAEETKEENAKLYGSTTDPGYLALVATLDSSRDILRLSKARNLEIEKQFRDYLTLLAAGMELKMQHKSEQEIEDKFAAAAAAHDTINHSQHDYVEKIIASWSKCDAALFQDPRDWAAEMQVKTPGVLGYPKGGK